MEAPIIRHALLMAVVAGIAACHSSTEPTAPPAASVVVVRDTASGSFGSTTILPFMVKVLDQSGKPVGGATVSFQPSSGSTVSPTSTTTGADGTAQTLVTIGGPSGPVQVTATVQGTGVTITGQPVMRLNANANDPCSNIQVRAGYVAAVTTKSIIVADTANPAGGFTPTEYGSIGATFDTLVDPLDRNAFGAPTDIDKNGGRAIIFFTAAVNQLTPANSQGVVGGFFYERDLFPRTNSAQAQGCAGSNVGEMFYMLVPDPNGTINGNKRDTAFVRTLTIGTTAHEYQHLINAARRLYVNNATDFEVVWLNEGLSHIAEELLYYRVAGLAPRQNITAATIRSSSTGVADFNLYQNNNFGRFDQFLSKAGNASPYADNDSLETRGATWNMLRYLADHRGSADADTWQLLVNSTTTGLANMTNVFGANLMDQIRDWAVSVETDDLAGFADARYLQPSWNLRDIFVNGYHDATYPLTVVPLTSNVVSTVNLPAGGEAYVRFSVPAGTSGSVDWQQSGFGAITTTSCQTSAATALAVGQVVDPVSGSGMCLDGGTTGAEFALIPFYSSQTSSAQQSLDILGVGVAPVATATRIAASGPFANVLDAGARFSRSPASSGADVGVAFESALRERARRELRPLIPAARQWYSRAGYPAMSRSISRPVGGASFLTVPPGMQVVIARTK